MTIKPPRKVTRCGKKCPRCTRILAIPNFYTNHRYKLGVSSYCKRCVRELNKLRHSTYRSADFDARERLFKASRSSAWSRNLLHTISPDDIDLPKTCAYLGVELDYHSYLEGRAPNAPSVDRIDNSKGYVPGNVQVISDLANRMKQNATIEQLVEFARGVLKKHAE